MKWKMSIFVMYKHISEINKVNKGKSKEPHTAGSKTFARSIHEEKKNGDPPSRAALYIKTRYSKRMGDYVTPEVAAIAEAMKADLEASGSTQSKGEKINWKDDIYSKHKRPEKKGRVRCMGKLMLSNGACSSNSTTEEVRQKVVDLLYKMVFGLADVVKDLHPSFSVQKLLEDNGIVQVLMGASGNQQSPSPSTPDSVTR